MPRNAVSPRALLLLEDPLPLAVGNIESHLLVAGVVATWRSVKSRG
jgi:hypothetical protein